MNFNYSIPELNLSSSKNAPGVYRFLNTSNYTENEYDWPCKKSRYINRQIFTTVFVSLLFVFGLTFNMLSFIVWTKGKKCKSIGCSMYFRFASLSDLLSIVNCLSFVCLKWYDFGSKICILIWFFLYFSPSLSSWLLVCIGVERYLSLKFPFTFMPLGAKKRAIIAFVSLVLILTCLNSYSFVASYDPEYNVCFVDDSFVDYHRNLGEIAILWTLCVIPLFLLNIINVLIFIQLYKNKRQQLGRSRIPEHATSFTKIAVLSCMLQSISICPLMIFMLKAFGYIDIQVDALCTWDVIVENTLYLNTCFSFFIYFFRSSSFRSDVKEMFYCFTRFKPSH